MKLSKNSIEKHGNRLVIGMIIMMLSIFGWIFSTVGYHSAVNEVDSLENKIDVLKKQREDYKGKYEDAEVKNQNLKARVNSADPFFKNMELKN